MAGTTITQRNSKVENNFPAEFIGAISTDAIKIIIEDEELLKSFQLTYRKLKEHISDLPLERQFDICLASIDLAVGAIRSYQEEQKGFIKSLKSGEHLPELPYMMKTKLTRED